MWAAGEQERLLLLLEPEEFLQGVSQLTQVLGGGLGSQPGCAVLPVLTKDKKDWRGHAVGWGSSLFSSQDVNEMREAGREQTGATAFSRGQKGDEGSLESQKPEVGNW